MPKLPFFLHFTQNNFSENGAIDRRSIWRIGKYLLVFIFIIGAYFLGTKTSSTNTSQATKTVVAKPYFSKTINNDLSIPVKDSSGNVVATLTYTVQSIDLQDQIILQGQKADAVSGRTFLVMNIKILNPSTQNMQLNSRDFIRVSIDNSSELLAPEIHSDPIAIQPISTKYTKLGLPIAANVKNVKLHVGEINGQKTIIDIPIK